jgi:hypothetical protein
VIESRGCLKPITWADEVVNGDLENIQLKETAGEETVAEETVAEGIFAERNVATGDLMATNG